jgi:hypothetical protein
MCAWPTLLAGAPRDGALAWLLAAPPLGAAWPAAAPPTPPRAKASAVTKAHPTAMAEMRMIVFDSLIFRMGLSPLCLVDFQPATMLEIWVAHLKLLFLYCCRWLARAKLRARRAHASRRQAATANRVHRETSASDDLNFAIAR